METIQDCIRFANENPVCYLATDEGGQPRVRVLAFWYADPTGFYFQTGAGKDLTGQLRANPKMEALFYKTDGGLGEVLRISGAAEFVDTPELRQKALADRPFLRGMGIDEKSPELVLFRLAHGKANFWTAQTNLKPKKYIEF